MCTILPLVRWWIGLLNVISAFTAPFRLLVQHAWISVCRCTFSNLWSCRVLLQSFPIYCLFFSILTAIFPGEPGLASFIEAKDDGSGGDNWSYKVVQSWDTTKCGAERICRSDCNWRAPWKNRISSTSMKLRKSADRRYIDPQIVTILIRPADLLRSAFCRVPAKLQSNHHHQHTNTQLFTGRMPFLSINQQCQSNEGKFATYYLHVFIRRNLTEG